MMKDELTGYRPVFEFPKTAGLCAWCTKKEKRSCKAYQEKCRKVRICHRYDVSARQLCEALLRNYRY